MNHSVTSVGHIVASAILATCNVLSWLEPTEYW